MRATRTPLASSTSIAELPQFATSNSPVESAVWHGHWEVSLRTTVWHGGRDDAGDAPSLSNAMPLGPLLPLPGTVANFRRLVACRRRSAHGGRQHVRQRGRCGATPHVLPCRLQRCRMPTTRECTFPPRSTWSRLGRRPSHLAPGTRSPPRPLPVGPPTLTTLHQARSRWLQTAPCAMCGTQRARRAQPEPWRTGYLPDCHGVVTLLLPCTQHTRWRRMCGCLTVGVKHAVVAALQRLATPGHAADAHGVSGVGTQLRRCTQAQREPRLSWQAQCSARVTLRMPSRRS